MDIFDKNHLRELAQIKPKTCVSLYMPAFRFESESAQNPIRLKNLVKAAHEQLLEEGHDEREADAILAPARERLDDSTYWRQQSDGLAAFMTPKGARFYRLPLHFEELAVTGQRFHLKPLFPLIASNNRFYVLALSQNNVRLYQGTHHAISEVESKEVPKSLAEALFYDDEEKTLQQHSVGGEFSGSSGDQESIYHGQGIEAEDKRRRPKDKLKRFFREVDHGLNEVLEEEAAPMLLAGVEYYLPLFREVNSYRHLVEDQIVAGNPDHLKPKDLHGKAWELMAPFFMKAQQEATDKFQQLSGNGDGLASDDLKQIVPASVYSRVDTVFVPIGQHLWGRYDAETNAVEVHNEHEAGDEDLLDLVAVNTYLNGGTVHALQPENMPAQQPLAATFRYQADVAATEQ